METICGFVQFLSRSLLPQSISNYLSGVKLLHILLGHEYYFADNIHLRLLMKGVRRLHPHTPRRAKPVVPELLAAIAPVVDSSDTLQVATYACSLLLFHTLARLGSVLPVSTRTKPHTFLTHHYINLTSDGMLVSMRHTKTIQFGQRRLHIPLVARDAVTCPVRAYRAHLLLRGRARLGSRTPAFIFTDAAGHTCWLTKSIFIRAFRDLAAAAGDSEPSAYSGHSFRRGGASWAFQAGVPGELIQVMGDWSSDAYKTYLEFDMRSKHSLHSLFSKNLP